MFLFDGGADFLGGETDLVEVIGSTEGDAERAGDFCVAEANGGENVRLTTLVGGTGSAGREVDFLLLELID